MLQYLVILGAAVSLTGSLTYARNTLRGRSKPNRVTFLMWALAPMIGAIAAWSAGVGWAALPVFMAGFGPLLTFFASFVNPQAYWKLGLFDYLCGLFSLMALVLWLVTKNPITAIVFAIISDVFASIPTLIKSWKFPGTETGITYVTALFGVLTSFAAIKAWTFSNYGFILYLITIDCLLIIAVFHRKLINTKSADIA